LGLQAIKQGHTVLYRSVFDLVRDFLHEEVQLSSEKVLAKFLKPDLLLIDDMGMKQLPKRSGEYLFEVIMRRYETRSTMMTSNRPLEDWGKLLGDVPSATAILDRFLHHATILTLAGRSYRLRHQSPEQPAKATRKSSCTRRRSRRCWQVTTTRGTVVHKHVNNLSTTRGADRLLLLLVINRKYHSPLA
jgi:hypothetical protein